MFCSVRFLAAAALALLWFAAGCSRAGSQGVDHVAIGHFENLTADPSLDWVSGAFPEVILRDLAGLENKRYYLTASPAAPEALGATHYLHGYFSLVRGRLRVHAVLENLKSRRMERTAAASGQNTSDVIAMASDIARTLDSHAKPYPAVPAGALQAIVEARSAPNFAQARVSYERALSLDPNYSSAYLGLSRLLLSRNDREAAQSVIDQALARKDRLDPIDLARIELYRATIDENRELQKAALLKLSELTPADSGNLRRLGELEAAERNYRQAADWYRKALRLDPNDRALLNQGGYLYAYAGDLAEAKNLLERYRNLTPGDANPFDSLGDVSFYTGQFADAESYYLKAVEINVRFAGGRPLAKAAYSRLMRGDRAGADALYQRYLASLEQWKDPLRRLLAAQYDYATGRQADARKALETPPAGPAAPPAIQAVEMTQRSAWALRAGDSAEAQRLAEEAERLATDASTKRIAHVCRFLVLPPAGPDVWRQRAEEWFPGKDQAPLRNLALGYALMLAQDFPRAAEVLRKVLPEITSGSSEPVTLLLGWAELEAGDRTVAGELLLANPVNQLSGDQIFSFLVFPRIFEWRARYFEQMHNREEAARNRRLYEMYSPSQAERPAPPATAQSGLAGAGYSHTRSGPPVSRSFTRS